MKLPESHTLPKISEVRTPKKKSIKLQTKALNFWDSMQTRGINKVTQGKKYRSDLQNLRQKVGINTINNYIFGIETPETRDFEEKYNEIKEKYVGKLYSSSVADNGKYIYTDSDLEEIKMVKKVNF